MAEFISKWSPGDDYGPLLQPLELYVLDIKLEINPVLSGEDKKHHLAFNIQTGTYENDHADQAAMDKFVDQPATLPRTSEIYLISRWSPWVTKVTNPFGVSIKDIMNHLHEQYTKSVVTQEEFNALPKRHADTIRRLATTASSPYVSNFYPSPAQPNSVVYRVHWLQGRHYFDSMVINGSYTEKRIGYKAPNIFVMDLLQ